MGDDFLNDDDLDLFGAGNVDSLDELAEKENEDEEDEDFGFTLGDDDSVQEDY